MNRDEHLNPDKTIKAVIDETDLDRTDLEHLKECRECRLKIDQFKRELNDLEQKADSTAPLPVKKPILPEQEISSFRFFKPLFAAGLTALLLVAFVWWPNNGMQINEETTAQILQEMDADEKLMAEIEELEGIALFDINMDASEETEGTEGIIEDEFMDFLIPEENDSVI